MSLSFNSGIDYLLNIVYNEYREECIYEEIIFGSLFNDDFNFDWLW